MSCSAPLSFVVTEEYQAFICESFRFCLRFIKNKNFDIWTEKGNDEYKYREKDTVRVAGQKDFDNF